MTIIGDVVLQLPPNVGNPRNSEGAFLELKDGQIIFVYSHFVGQSWHDDANAGIAISHSSDKGKTWSKSEIIIRPDEHNAKNIMSVSLLRMQNGDIGLFYLIRYGWLDMRLNLRRSSDEGKTWGEATCCIPRPGYFVTNNDRVIRLSSGRLIIPTGFHGMRGESTTDWKSFDHRSIVYFFCSDDDGYSWHEAKNFCALNYSNTQSGMQEPGVIELKNGVLWAWARTDLGRQYQMFSKDMGETWTLPEPSVFTSPCSPLSMKRIPVNGYLIAVWNPVPKYQTQVTSFEGGMGRTPLVLAVSRDEGTTWGNTILVEHDGNEGYSYVAIYFTEDSVLLAYCAGNSEDGHNLTRIRVKRILLSEIIQADTAGGMQN